MKSPVVDDDDDDDDDNDDDDDDDVDDDDDDLPTFRVDNSIHFHHEITMKKCSVVQPS